MSDMDCPKCKALILARETPRAQTGQERAALDAAVADERERCARVAAAALRGAAQGGGVEQLVAVVTVAIGAPTDQPQPQPLSLTKRKPEQNREFPKGRFKVGDQVRLKFPDDYAASFNDPAGVFKVMHCNYFRRYTSPVYSIRELSGGVCVTPFGDDDLTPNVGNEGRTPQG